MKKVAIILLSVCLFVNFFSVCKGQNKLTHFSIDNGLLSNTVLDIVVNPTNNNAWATFEEGIMTYNGATWEEYNFPEDVPDNSLKPINFTPDGAAWFMGDSRFVRIKGNNSEFFEIEDKQISRSTTRSFVDSKGDIWFLIDVKSGGNSIQFFGLLLYQESSFYFFDAKDDLFGSLDRLEGIWEVNNEILIGDNDGELAKFNGSAFEPVRSANCTNCITSMAMTSTGEIWTVGDGAIIRGMPLTIFPTIGNISGWQALNISEDDVLWAGAFQGYIAHIDLKNPESKWILDTGNGIERISNQFVFPSNIITGKLGTCYLIGNRVDGFYRYSRQEWTQYTTDNGLLDNDVQSIKLDNSGNAWIITKTNLTFFELSPPAEPSLLVPTDEAIGIPLVTTFSWMAAENAATYQIQISEDESFTNLIENSDTLSSSSLDFTLPDYETIYYWRVRAINFTGNSDWSEARSFTTEMMTTRIEEKELVTSLKVYPNPAKEEIFINFYSASAFYSEIAVYNSVGKLVHTGIRNFISGKNSIHLKLQNLPRGSYFFRISGEDRSVFQRFLLIK